MSREFNLLNIQNVQLGSIKNTDERALWNETGGSVRHGQQAKSEAILKPTKWPPRRLVTSFLVVHAQRLAQRFVSEPLSPRREIEREKTNSPLPFSLCRAASCGEEKGLRCAHLARETSAKGEPKRKGNDIREQKQPLPLFVAWHRLAALSLAAVLLRPFCSFNNTRVELPLSFQWCWFSLPCTHWLNTIAV